MQRANRPDNQCDPRRRSQAALSTDVLALATLPVLLLCAYAAAVVAQSPSPRSKLPLAEPVVEFDVIFRSSKGNVWTGGGTELLLLDGDVTLAIGRYAFAARRAYARIDREVSYGRQIRHVMIYLEEARAPHRKRAIAEAPRLLITVSITGRIELSVDHLDPSTAAGDSLAVAGEQRFERYLRTLEKPLSDVPEGPPLDAPDATARRTGRRRQIEQQNEQRRAKRMDELITQQPEKSVRPTMPPAPDVTPEAKPIAAPSEAEVIALAEPILPSGIVSLRFDNGVYQDVSDEEAAVALMGNVAVMYEVPDSQRTMTLQAQNAVLFVPTGAKQIALTGRMDVGEIHGIYLENNVIATDGTYTVRAPRVYYDLARNKAILLEAVFYTWDIKRQVPIYVRAQKLRQESTKTWSAERALLTTSEFAEPHFSIGADRLSFGAEQMPDGTIRSSFTAKNVSLNVGQTPIALLPTVAGNSQEVPLVGASAGYSNQNGAMIQTSWDIFSILGRRKPDGVDMTGHVDVRGDHGPGVGLDIEYDLVRMYGFSDNFLLFDDNGEDEIGGRNDVEQDGDTRGRSLWRHRQYLRNNWELSLEFAYVSDETFLEEFFREEAEEDKDHETLLYLKKQEEGWAFTFLAEYDLQEFVEQTTTLQSAMYSVDKLPELGYYRIGTSLFDDRLTYFTENRLSRVRIRPSKDRPVDRGFNATQSMVLFGIAPGTSFDNVLAEPSDVRIRADTRHELQAPLKIGALDVVPYAAGRVTAYDTDFSSFAGENEEARLWGALGTRLRTALSKHYDSVDNRILDLHRLRHVVEPSVDVFLMGSNINPESIPVYDTDVEAIHEGAGTRLGLRNVLQTERGGAGRWRSVDWLALNTDLVFRANDTDIDTEIPRFFSYRPEFGLGGDHFYTDLMWMVSDTLATVGDLTYSLEHHKVVQWHYGTNMRHTPRLSSFVEYAMIDDIPSRLLGYGFQYRLTPKYTMGFRHTLDLGGSESREIDLTIERRLPRWRLILVASHDEVDDDTSIGVALIPEGIRSSRLLRPFDTIAIE